MMPMPEPAAAAVEVAATYRFQPRRSEPPVEPDDYLEGPPPLPQPKGAEDE